MPTSIEKFPGEVFEIILSDTAPTEYLKVKLVSKHFSKWADTVFKWEEMTKTEVIQGQTSLEACLDFPEGQRRSVPKGQRRLDILTCTHCGLLKKINRFSDNQAAQTNPTRFCISCGIISRKYTKGRRPTINGEEHIPCTFFQFSFVISTCPKLDMLFELGNTDPS